VLPLLQAVLHALYDRSRQGYLTVEAYRAIGGLSGLLSRDAEEIFDSFDEATRQTSLNILTRLVSVMPDGSIVRRVAAASELSLGERSAQSQEVLNRLVQARLVAVSSQADSEPRYVLAHDALVRAWPRLQREIEREADWLRARSRLSDAVAHWEAAGRSAELLYPEIEINRVAGEKMPARPERGLNGSEVQFLEASRRRVRRRRLAVRAVVASFAMFAVMATVLAITASRARDIARTEAASSARVSEFLMSLFATADPTTNRGNNLTVRELLDRGATAADLSLATEPAIRSRLLTTMAQAYIGLGFYSPAGELLKQAEADQRAGGVPAEETVRTRVVLGTNYAKQGDYEAAERTLSAALALARASGVSGPVRSEALTRLAEVTMDTGRVEEAIRLSSEAVSAERARSPSDPLAVASSLNALGSAYYLAGQYSNAEAALRESLALRQRVLGRTDARTGESIASLASLLYSEQKLPEAIRLFREALNIYQLVYGPSHPEVGSLYFNMGVADLLVGNVAQAEPSLRRALEIRERSLGSDNRENIAPLTYLAMIDIAAKRLAIANAEVQRALDIARSTRRSDFEPPLDQVLISAADLARAGGERELANALLSQANAVLEQYYRPKSEGNEWRYARLDMVNASVLLAGGLTADARPILLDALAVFLRLYGPRGFFTKDAEERLASLDASPSADRRGPSARALSAAGQ
jgi:Tfp pilus assembly protein PilF